MLFLVFFSATFLELPA